VDSFYPKLDGCVGVSHHSSSILGDCTDDSLSDAVIVERVRCAQCMCFTTHSGHRVESLMMIFSSAINTPQSSDLIAHGIHTGIKGLVGGGASFRT
jgi:hypothetical protein